MIFSDGSPRSAGFSRMKWVPTSWQAARRMHVRLVIWLARCTSRSRTVSRLGRPSVGGFSLAWGPCPCACRGL
eukprot:6681502-Prymnesium_polylepis.1